MKDLHKRWSHRWMHPRAFARQSNKEGLGVFALGQIKKGEVVGVLGGVIVHKKEIDKYWRSVSHVGIQIDHDFFIVPTSRKELENFGVYNHSCEPNIGFSNSITLVALRDIKKDEELAFDYAFCETYFEGFVCKCDSQTCRKRVTPRDWKDKKLQSKYKEYFSPYLKKLF